MKIGFYDSGLGGLTVLKEALSKIPNRHFVYYGDTKNVPYGEKSDDEVNAFAQQAAEYLVGKGAGCIVVACNAASSAAGQALRESMNVPIICMEPAINLAAKNNQERKRILVFSTNLTLKLEKYKNLKSQLQYQNIDELATPRLVEFAEQFRVDNEVRNYLHDCLAQYNLNEYSFIVLGCTHFTFFQNMIQDMLPEGVRVIDGNAGTVNRLLTVAGEHSEPSQVDIHLTGNCINEELIRNYLSMSEIKFI